MIFAVPGHTELIKQHIKVETRRRNDRYKKGETYSIQPKRTAKGIPEGRIKITAKCIEHSWEGPIDRVSAIHEGNYTVLEYERLYERLNPKWTERVAYLFEYVPTQINSGNEMRK